MKEQDIPILGVCRFSMLGRGDWKGRVANVVEIGEQRAPSM